MSKLVLNGQPLTIADVAAVARHDQRVALGDDARRRAKEARALVDRCAAGTSPTYGVNPGFGSLSRQRIDGSDLRDLQRNLLRSHAAGVGDPLPRDASRAILLILAASLARGHSGVRPVVIGRLVDLLNAGLTPVIPSSGSVGASGDLAPLAHAALTLIGEGVIDDGRSAGPAGDALGRAGLEPITLEAKEGLALINGTHYMAGLGALALADTTHLIDAAIAACALAIDACRATDRSLDDRLHALRGHRGPREVARRMRELLAGSQITPSHREDDPRVQDPYSLRTIPPILGAAIDRIDAIRAVVETELGAVTDNPLVFADAGDIVSGANFHGMPLALALDGLPVALAALAGVAERRLYWLLSAVDAENPVPAYLSPQPGLHSGFMVAQYTAAACCNEIATLGAPASAMNIPTAAGIEDFNSMGATSARQALAAVGLARSVVAIELIVMTQGLEYQRPLRSGSGVEAIAATVRTVVPPLEDDRVLADDFRRVEGLIAAGAFGSAISG